MNQILWVIVSDGIVLIVFIMLCLLALKKGLELVDDIDKQLRKLRKRD
jgi:hypothetical protein